MTKGEYSALDVAKFILKYCTDKKKPISNLKLQKILYFSWIDYYNKTGHYLFGDKIEAWQFGPVLPSVYYEFSRFGGMPIVYPSPLYKEKQPVLENEDQATMKELVSKYLELSAYALVDLSHESHRPWKKVFDEGKGLRKEIDFDCIISMECASVC